MAGEREPAHDVDRIRGYRESVLYPQLFGQSVAERHSLSLELAAKQFPQASARPHWSLIQVFAWAPTGQRRSWLYVTSGLSDDKPASGADSQRPAGRGCELMLETSARSAWAIGQLHCLIVHQLLAGDNHLLGDFDRLPPFLLPQSDGPAAPIAWLILAPPRELPQEATLHSGYFDLHQIVSLDVADEQFARSHGPAAALARMKARTGYPVIQIASPTSAAEENRS